MSAGRGRTGVRAWPTLVLAATLAAAAGGCAETRAALAPTSDLDDYRHFRLAASEGTRLRRAMGYLARHPDGTFAAEVRDAFAREEPRYWSAALATRAGALRYAAELPEGPHAHLLPTLLAAHARDDAAIGLRALEGDAARAEGRLEALAEQRRRASALAALAVAAVAERENLGLVDEAFGPALARALAGDGRVTWGGGARRSHDRFFRVPVAGGLESRVLTVDVEAVRREGRVLEVRAAGPDLFVRWFEAERLVVLDPASPADRAEAAAFALERIAGALEATYPPARCRADAPEALVLRRCDGLEVEVAQGAGPGDDDRLVARVVKTPP